MALSNTQFEILHSPSSSPSSSPPVVHNMLVENNNDKEHADNPTEPHSPNPDGSVPMAVDNEICLVSEDVVFSLEISRYVSQSAYMEKLYQNSKEHLEALSAQSESTAQTVQNVDKPGVSQECPILVDGVSKADMNAFVGVLHVQREWGASRFKGKAYSKDEIMQFVRLAQRWELTSIEEQFYRLLGLPGQTPAFRLSLVFQPINKSPSELRRLTYEVYRAVTFARDAIMVQRAAIAAHFPTIPKIDDRTHTHSVCVDKCFYLWRVHITKPLLEGQEPAVDARDSFVEAMAKENLMNRGCREHMRVDLVNHPDWETRWGKEDYVLRKLKEKIERIIQQGGQ
ncbi:hypothetical protein BJ165DRAFT_1523954 [Panaeolus papilionaceus]|nr:hypothetical protein BJ165DRAFT_1523954 [Panaeolus papilionaceus]